VRRVVHVGTEAALMHGQPLVHADERTPLALSSKAPYPATKAAAEAAVVSADDSRARADLGYAPVVTREEGLAALRRS
jgi:nucleoside-diphosphate-sugar epimerase